MFVCAACGQRFERGGTCPADGQPLVESADPLLGTEIGRYRLTRLLGEGGMGQVYLGVQPAIGSRVAVKVLSADCARSPELLERFFAEARAVNMIKHESIVNVLDMAQLADGRPYIVMEFIEGRTLGSLVRGGDAPLGGVVQVTSEVLSALGAAHALGIVHRDLKPDNILVTAEGHAKVLDFGIAKLTPELSNNASPRTRTGALLGTPAYMAPEQISGAGSVDARTDIYAAGIVLFEAVTGRVPFHGATLYDLMRAHLEMAPPAPRSLRADLPAPIEDVILTALAKDPAHRFQTTAAMANALYGAARALRPEQWRALSARDGVPPARMSMDALVHATPRFTPPAMSRDPNPDGHAPTVRSATAVSTNERPDAAATRANASTAMRRSRRGIAIGAVALVAALVGVALIALSQRGGGDDTGAGSQTVAAAAPGAGSGSASKVVTPPAPVPSVTTTATPPPAPTTTVAPPSPAGPTTHPASPVTARSDPGRTVSPPSTPTTRPTPATGPTIVGGGSAADHGVHIGSNVQLGPNVVIGGGTQAAPPAGTSTSFTRPIDYNPKAFDAKAYLPKALALARQLYKDAQFVRFDTYYVFPNGLSNLSASDDETTYWFRSPSHSARPAGVPRNVEVEIPCYVEVEVGPREVRVWIRDISTDANCKSAVRPFPRCSVAKVWEIAKSRGAALDTIAKVAFLEDGEWWFDNEDSDGNGLAESYPDRCQ